MLSHQLPSRQFYKIRLMLCTPPKVSRPQMVYLYLQLFVQTCNCFFLESNCNGDEIITPKLIVSVAETELKALYPIIQEFRIGNNAALETALDVFK